MKRRKYSTKLPKGWTFEQIEKVREHYENQSEEEALAEDEALAEKDEEAFVIVPKKLVPEVKKMIAAHLAKRKGRNGKVRRVA
jgi:hypothetical protein